MTVIVDSGGTKTDWCVIEGARSFSVRTKGINPVVQSDEEMASVIKSACNLILCHKEILCDDLNHIKKSVFFYGAGCNERNIPRLLTLLQHFFGKKSEIEVNSDLVAAARALFGDEAGVACILGTGSNSCLYDGRQIVQHTPALGYVLGDEGSGAVLGRLFLNAIFKGVLSTELRDKYLQEEKMTVDDVLTHVYKGNMPNRFLASTSLFISRHLDDLGLRNLVLDNFRTFFKVNILPYDCVGMNIGAVGSIAYVYEEQLREAAMLEGLTISRIIQSPMRKLILYHAGKTV